MRSQNMYCNFPFSFGINLAIKLGSVFHLNSYTMRLRPLVRDRGMGGVVTEVSPSLHLKHGEI